MIAEQQDAESTGGPGGTNQLIKDAIGELLDPCLKDHLNTLKKVIMFI